MGNETALEASANGQANRLADMTLSLPQWLTVSLSEMGSGAPISVPAECAPSEMQRAYIAGLITDLEGSLTPASEREIAAEFTKLILAFPAQSVSQDVAAIRAEAYFTALSDLPAWALREACRKWLRGEADGNLAFAPSPPQLRRLADEALIPVRAQMVRLRKLLHARGEGRVCGERSVEMRRKFEALSASLVGIG